MHKLACVREQSPKRTFFHRLARQVDLSAHHVASLFKLQGMHSFINTRQRTLGALLQVSAFLSELHEAQHASILADAKSQPARPPFQVMRALVHACRYHSSCHGWLVK